jgi:predicted ATPase/class 3 adenylate cyclase
MVGLPSGTVTFLFTDLEGSTRLWDEHPGVMRAALARHDEILRDTITAHDGYVVKSTGDGVHAVFATAHDSVAAAVAAQRALTEESWDNAVRLRVRMGVHSGEAELRDGDYYGSATNSAARLMSAATGGQVLVSGVTAALVQADLAVDVELWPLGEHRLRDLAAPMAVFQVAAPGLAREFPPLVSLDASPGNLPAQLSSLVGREEEVAEVAGLLRDHRLVTLTGVGGVGKTRLALAVAGEVLPGFADGAWVVELAKVRDPAAVVEAVAAALGAPKRPEVPALDMLASFLRVKRLLLVLDNCEHVLDAAAGLVRTLEGACPNLVVLATSREGLGIRGERLVAVASLGDADAELLFVERAQAVKHDFALSGTNVAAVRELCRRLDGIPLAIELAAARVSVLSPAQIAARLDQRFALLAGGERGAIERHATLRAAIDWSYDLLAPDEQLMLARLSMFAGSCTLDAAEAVCAVGDIAAEAVIDLIASLVARSLVVADHSAADTSYRLLETIRQYAEAHLHPDDRAATAGRHARYYAQWLVTAGEHLQGPEQASWVGRAEQETENVRAAITWAVSSEDEELAFAMLVAVDIAPLAFLPTGRAVWVETERILDLVRATSQEHLARAIALDAYGALARGDRDTAQERLDEAAALNGTEEFVAQDIAWIENWLALMSGDETRAMKANMRSVEWARRTGRTFDLAGALAGVASQHANRGDFDVARAEATEALEHARRTGAPSAITMARAALAFALIETDPEAARTHLQALSLPDALALEIEEGALLTMAVLGARLDEVEATLRVGAHVLDATPSTPLALGAVLETAAAVLASRTPEAAATLHGAVDAIVPGFADLVSLRPIAGHSAETRLNPDVALRLYEGGSRLSEDEAAALARTLIEDALASLTAGTAPLPP